MLFFVSEFFQFMYQLFYKSSKIVGFIGMIILAYIAGTANPMVTPDYSMYETLYRVRDSSGFYFEKGYSELSLFFYSHGIDYVNFRLGLCLISFTILFIGVSRFTNNVAIFCGIYAITIFFVDASQIRNLVMLSLVVLAFSFLRTINARNIIIATTLVIISAEFQSLAYIFLLVILVLILNRHGRLEINDTTTSMIIILGITLLLLFNILGVNNISAILTKIVSVFINRPGLANKVSEQYTYGTTWGKMLLISISAMVGLVCVSKIREKMMTAGVTPGKLDVLYWMSALGVICLPFLTLAIDYSRIQRDVFAFIIIGIAMYTQTKKSKFNDRILLGSFCFITCVVFGVTHNFIWGQDFLENIPFLIKIVTS